MNNKTNYLQKNYWESQLLHKDVYNLRFNSTLINNIEKIKKEIFSLSNNSMVYIRFPIEEMNLKAYLKMIGFYKVDTYIDWRILRNEIKHETNKDFSLVDYKENELQQIQAICKEIFKHSRFHNDKNISNSKASKSRVKWFEDSIEDKNKKIYTYRTNGKVLGFLIEKGVNKKTTIDLVGVSNNFQKQGHGNNLMKLYLNKKLNKTIHVGTQLENSEALNLYLNHGFKFYKVFNTFHLHL